MEKSTKKKDLSLNNKYVLNFMYSSYKAVWRIAKLIVIAYEKIAIARN